MQIDNLIERIEDLVSTLSESIDGSLPESAVESMARELEADLLKLAMFEPRNFDESLKLTSLFIRLIETVHDDIDLAKKYSRLASKHLQRLKDLTSVAMETRKPEFSRVN